LTGNGRVITGSAVGAARALSVCAAGNGRQPQTRRPDMFSIIILVAFIVSWTGL
jgi:hypothetical protein